MIAIKYFSEGITTRPAEEQSSLLVFTMIISALQENVSLFAYKQENKIYVHQYGCKILKSKKYTCIHWEK